MISRQTADDLRSLHLVLRWDVLLRGTEMGMEPIKAPKLNRVPGAASME